MTFLFLGDWFHDLSGPHQIFWGIALIFSVLFVIQFVVSLFGFDFDSDVDADIDVGEVDVDVEGGYSLDPDFALFSVRSIIAFFTFFGWTGVFLLNSGSSVSRTVTLASLSGLAAMLVVAYMLYLFAKLGQSGNIDMDSILFESGTVYLTIPGDRKGIGKINVKVGNSIKEVRAVTEGQSIPTGKTVRVIEVMKDNILLVEPSQELLLERENSSK